MDIVSTERLAVVAAIAVVIGLVALLYRVRRRGLARVRPDEPTLPDELTHGERTWVVFTTPYCATCGPVTARIARFDPGARLLTIDVSDRPDLARRHDVRAAPTVLLAEADGTVRARFVGDVDGGALVASLAGGSHHDRGRHE
jgi:hypothetical protein